MDTPPVPNANSVTGTPSVRWVWGLLVVLAVTAAVRWHRLELPLERDEGEYAYAGQLMLEGMPPYVGAYNMKLPGIYLAYTAILGVFGQSVWAIHSGLLLVNLASICLVYLIGRRLIDARGAFFSAATFAVLSAHASVTGLFANSEHFVVLPMLGGVLFLLKAIESDRLWQWGAAGVLMGTAFVMKQHGVMFIGMGVAVVAYQAWRNRPVDKRACAMRMASYGVGAALPFASICVWMLATGVFSNFWFWTFTYASHYVSQVTLADGFALLKHQLGKMAGELTGLWLFAGLGGVTVLVDPELRKRSGFWLLWALASWAAVCPGLLFRNHYFLFVLPVASLLVGAAVASRIRSRTGSPGGRTRVVLFFTAAIVWAIVGHWNILVGWPNETVSRSIYGLNPFPESVGIGEYLNSHTTPEDTIAVIGSEPQIYFYARRHAATSHIYTYALMEEHPFALNMQREMRKQIEEAKPKFVVFVNVRTSWLTRPGSHQELLDWAPTFTASHYELVGLTEIEPTGSKIRWNEAVEGLPLPGPDKSWLSVYRRKGE